MFSNCGRVAIKGLQRVALSVIIYTAVLLITVTNMFGSRPNPKKAYKELRSNLLTFGTLCVAIRLTPFILHLAQKASSK